MRKAGDAPQERLAAGLSGLLADTYVLYNLTQTSHWNVEGPQFHSLHDLFERQYKELAEAVDVIAERIRSLGFLTPGSLAFVTKLSRIRQTREVSGSEKMLQYLIEAHQQIVHRASELRGEAEDSLDEGTADLLVERLRYHEKALWILRSQADRGSKTLAAVEDFARVG